MTVPTITINLELNQIEAGEFVVGTSLVGGADVIGDGLSQVESAGVRCSIRRGRWEQIYDDFEAATVSVVLNNEDRKFDPSYAAGDYFGELLPGRDIVITAGGVTVFTGFVQDYDLEYDVSGRSVTVLKATDALGRFAALEFDQWTNTGRDAATKLSNICNRSEVRWPSGLRDFIGAQLFSATFSIAIAVPLQSESVSWGSNVLNYMRLCAQSDWLSFLFASADGLLTLRPVINLEQLGNSWVPSNVASFGGSGIPFQTIVAQYGSEDLYSEVSVDFEGGTAQTVSVADPAAWQLTYGPQRRLSLSGLLLDQGVVPPITYTAEDMAEFLAIGLLAFYDTPTFRITEISVQLASLSPANQATVLGIDIANIVDISFTPNGVGAAIEQTLAVQGIAHEITPDSHVVTFSVIDYTV
jgi:hypothetical protein